jgi:DNA-binding beta-propeller fold protein YncE
MKKIMSYFTPALLLLFTACGGTTETAETTAEQTTLEEMPTMDVSIEEVWATDTVMRNPESVLYDADNDVLYVANIGEINKEGQDGDGYISKLSPDGSVTTLKWTTGLNDPKGMGMHGSTLYVTDITELVAIDLETGEVSEKFPVDGALFLNDITVSSNGTVFATDSDTDKIHQLQNGEVTTWMSDSTLQRPNGLLAEDDRILLASAGGGFLAPINLSSKTVEDHWIDEIPSADGIIKTEEGDYIVSTWQGEVHYVDPKNNQSQKLLDTKAQEINAADIGYIGSRELLLVPTFFDNRVVAYKVTKN